jgi:hypothetical protein
VTERRGNVRKVNDKERTHLFSYVSFVHCRWVVGLEVLFKDKSGLVRELSQVALMVG